MNLVDWFDPHDRVHLEAYRYLTTKGMWPLDFLPQGIKINHLWQVLIANKMADCWLNHVLGE